MSARTDAEATNNQLSSGVTPEHLQTVLKDKLEAQHVEIADLSGTAAPPPQPFLTQTTNHTPFARRAHQHQNERLESRKARERKKERKEYPRLTIHFPAP